MFFSPSSIICRIKTDLPVYNFGAGADLDYMKDLINKVLDIISGDVLLIRPDGFVAWQCREQTPTSGLELMQALLKVLGI